MMHARIMASQPRISELTFTNLFIWHSVYQTEWSVYQDWLFIIGSHEGEPFALPPVGPGPREKAVMKLMEYLEKERGAAKPRLERADSTLMQELESDPALCIQPMREQYDYVYRSRDLIELTGNRYHRKRNHINAMQKKYSFRYEPMEEIYVHQCTELVEKWCGIKRCEEDMNLLGEWEAVGEMLAHYQALGVRGGVILIEDRVAAFAFGEMLNPTTAVIHIEKADPEIGELYAVINQQFAAHEFSDASFINREQDLGEPGLRTAKMSYHPDHLVEKFLITISEREKGNLS
ncbi:MAG: DUF2156 domain-containing protein [candidate division WOR-3 bacterium]|nr:MAG: DUF2156 domain-containing protein [candidate division WOR-3 bacterium]